MESSIWPPQGGGQASKVNISIYPEDSDVLPDREQFPCWHPGSSYTHSCCNVAQLGLTPQQMIQEQYTHR